MEKYDTIDKYIASFPEASREILEQIRSTFKQIVPEAEEAICYGIPTLRLKGNLVHYAAYKNHIGFYPGASGVAAFREELSDYNVSKGTVQFPIDKPIPFDLLIKIINFRVKENMLKAGLKNRKGK